MVLRILAFKVYFHLMIHLQDTLVISGSEVMENITDQTLALMVKVLNLVQILTQIQMLIMILKVELGLVILENREKK